MSAERIAELLVTLVRALVDDEDAVSVGLLCESMHTNYMVTMGPNDFGKVVGRGGQNAEALRLIVNAVGNKLGLPTCLVQFQDPAPDRRRNHGTFGGPRGR